MKIRNGFVSNSSSSSFILFKTYLTDEQLDHIRNWKTYAVSDEYKLKSAEYNKANDYPKHASEMYNDWINHTTLESWKDLNPDATPEDLENKKKQWAQKALEEPDFSEEDYSYYPVGWLVEETDNILDINTIMNNFDFIYFLKVIGVDVDKYGLRLFEEHYPIVGLNDVLTDINEYYRQSEEEYWNNYDKFFEKSKGKRS